MEGFIFLGYRVKQPWATGPEWAPIELICSVGQDLCEPPENWVSRWDFNRAFCYPTPEAAWATVEEGQAAYRLFAYFILPVRLYDGKPPTLIPLDEIFDRNFPGLPDQSAIPPEMVELGYDIAEHQFEEIGYPFSPLVTNGFAHEFPTNRYGLIEERFVATRACEIINDRMPEHAPHWVLKVWGQDVDEARSGTGRAPCREFR